MINTQTPYDIIVIAGQSNADGNGRGGEILQTEDGIDELIDRHHISHIDAPDSPTGVVLDIELPTVTVLRPAQEREKNGEILADFAQAFANLYVKSGRLAPGRRVLIVKTAVGGTGFARKEWGVGCVLSDHMMTMLREAVGANPENRIVAFLWHQGEHDAFERKSLSPGERHDLYVDDFSRQVGIVRDEWGNMPVITGDFVDTWAELPENKAACDAVEKAFRTVCAKIGNAACVSSEGLLSNDQAIGNGDNIHFCRASIYELGKRYFEKFEELTR